MDWNNLKAGKKAAQEKAPDPIDHVPEAPIISEEEAQVVESADDQKDTGQQRRTDDDQRVTDSGNVPEDGVRITPHHDDKR